jgi:hypothetical protein
VNKKMGQYYKPVNLDKKEYMYTHDFKTRFIRQDGKIMYLGQGLKLMEHSYINNPVMNAVESMIIPGGGWYRNRLVWAGDYADHEPGYEKTPQGYDVNISSIMDDEGTKIRPSSKKVDKKYRYLTNHTKQLVIDLLKIKEDQDGWKIHPLSLLVCEGNGRGGGDFIGEDSRIGTWSRDMISLEESVIDGYKLMSGQFTEER